MRVRIRQRPVPTLPPSYGVRLTASITAGPCIGWTPFDPTSGEAGRVGAAHIALLDSGDVQNIGIRVTNYAPRATKRVPYIARELQWSVGEKRTYGVYRDGERIGTEVAAVGDIEVVDGQEVYHFNARSEVTTGAGREVTVAEQLLTPQALPRQIVLEHTGPIKNDSFTYQFAEDTVVIKPGKPGEEEFEKSAGREYPFAKGTYFTDPRLLSHWVLMAGQVPLDPTSEKEFPVHTFVPGAKSKKEMLLEVGEKEEISLTPSFSVDKRKAPEENEATPTEDKAAPTEGEAAPSEGEAAPSEGEAVPAEGEAASQAGATPTEEPPKEGTDGRSISGGPLDNLPSATSQQQQATHLITDSGLEFWLNDRSQIVKVEIPDQGLELILEKVETSLE